MKLLMKYSAIKARRANHHRHYIWHTKKFMKNSSSSLANERGTMNMGIITIWVKILEN